MARYIKLETCGTCPHRDHKGAFGPVAYVPCCGAFGGKELPWEPGAGRSGRVFAVASEVIPDWCPLPAALD